MSRLFVDLFFYGMVKSTLADPDLSVFRGINRMVQEYALRAELFTGFSDVHWFASRLPSIAKGSFSAAGVDVVDSPSTPFFREKSLDLVNRWDRRQPFTHPIARKCYSRALAAARLVFRCGLMDDIYLPTHPQKGDLWLSSCTYLTQQVRELGVTRVLFCHDLNHVFHYREMGLDKPVTDPLANLALDIQPTEWVICISEYSKSCFLRYHQNFPPEQAFVIPLGADLHVSSDTAQPDATVLSRHGLEPNRYFFTLAAGGLHKNSSFIVEEFANWCATSSTDNGYKLVLSGLAQSFILARLSPQALQLVEQGRIIFTGFVPDEELPALYRHCSAFVFASLAEGFGLPPLEAMLHGAPVLCSDRTSLPEVVGDAGILFDPTQGGALLPLFSKLMSDPGVREDLSIKSKQRASQFSWAESTRRLVETLHVIRERSQSTSER